MARLGTWRAWRRWLRQIHLWIALVLCLPLVVLGLTGSILVFEDELGRALNPRPSATEGTPQPISRIIAAAQVAAPQGMRPTFYTARSTPEQPAVVRFAPPGQVGRGPGALEVFIDAATLAPLGTRAPSDGFLRTMFRLHANAMMPGRDGRAIIGWLGVAMVALTFTGFALWWPRQGRWKAAFGIKRGARGLRLHLDLHGMVGFWSLPVFLIVGLTGVYLGFPQTMGGAIASVLPARDLRGTAAAIKVQPIRDTQPADIDAIANLALAQAPGSTLGAIMIPARANQPYRVSLQPTGYRNGAPMVTVFVDPWRSRVVELRNPKTYSAGETLIAWQHALHAGAGLGWVWRCLVFLSGLLPLLFSVTGVTIYLLRRRNRRLTRAVSLAE